MNSIVRFFKNKNTVTVIGVIIIVALLWGGYYYQVQKQVKPVSVPVAAVTIQPRTQITSEMITYVEVPEAYITENAITNEDDILSMYAHYNTVIPAGSMFYNEAVTTAEAMPNYLLTLLKEGEIGLSYDLGTVEGPAPAIMPGEKIDIYMRVTTEEGSVMLGKLIENIEVLAVTDSEGYNVYEVNDGSRTPAYLNFGVQEDIFLLLMRAQYLDVEFFPIQHGAWKDDKNAQITLTTQELIDYINARVVKLSTDPVAGANNQQNTTIQQVQ